MNKEEILKKHTEEVFFDTENGGRGLRTVVYYEKAMQEYADLQTEQLKKQLEEKEKEVERLNDELKLNRADAIKYKQAFDEKCCTVANLADDVEQLQSQLSEKDKELSELKAKHEKDVKTAWQKGSESWIRGAQTAEQYYNQTHGQ